MSFKKHNFISKLLCMALALLMLVGALVSCGKEDGKNKSDASPNTQAPSDETDSPENERPTPYQDDFGSYSFRVLEGGADHSERIEGDMMGSIVEQAMFSRTDAVEAKYNVDVVSIPSGNPITAATNSAMSNDDDYDMINYGLKDTVELALSGYLWDLNNVEWLNLEASYYNQIIREQSTFAHKLFFLTGDLLTGDETNVACLFFNHKIWNDLDLDQVRGKHLYDIIMDREWTVDLMEEYSKRATYDLNGDDVMDRSDMWGYHHSNSDILSLNTSFGNDLITKNEDDVFVLNTSAKQQEDLQRIIEFFNTDYCVGHTYKLSVFPQGRQLFCLGMVGGVLQVTEGIDYGYAPFPMRDEAQKEYRNWMSTYGPGGITIFKTVTDVNRSASIIELLSYESQSRLQPVLIDYLMAGRPVPHPEDSEVLKLIFKNMAYELAYLWRGTGAYTIVCELNTKKSTDVASALKGSESMIAAEVQRMLEKLENNTKTDS